MDEEKDEYDLLNLNLPDDMKIMLQKQGITPEQLRNAIDGLGKACNEMAEAFKKLGIVFENYTEATRFAKIQEKKKVKTWKKKRFYE